ncbi:heavy-metal-associated domain-containing protein [Negadavirga shengliensis]|uniref:Heavy-metal-associated domain-containing protein n=1 Tax=Negadavirga shengliensis TaxID=1389218 RepID=A0ABV9T5U3_9BACT
MIKLKTNVKCAGCVATITPSMEKLKANHWEVDLQHPDKLLTVEGKVTEDEVKKALQNAGYKGESI